MEKNLVEKVIRDVINQYDREQNDITLDMAVRLCKKVMLKAREMNVKSVVAITNRGGNPILVNCDDDSYIASYDIALNKAYTVVALKMSTKELGYLAKPGGSLYGIQFSKDNRIVIFGGGEPLKNKKGVIVGGLGVSGGSAEQDTYLGEFGRMEFEKGI